MTKIQTKTKTAVAIALSVISIGSIMAGLYYYSWRGAGGDNFCVSCAPCPKCPVCPVASDDEEDEEEDGSNIDLAITGSTGASAICGVCDNVPWGTNMTIKNLGSNAAKAFTIKIYRGSASGRLLRTIDVSGLAAGETTVIHAAVSLKIATHTWGTVTMVIVPNAADTDTNLSNNTARRSVSGV